MSQLSLNHKHERFTFPGKNAVFVGEKKRKGERGEERRGERKEGEEEKRAFHIYS